MLDKSQIKAFRTAPWRDNIEIEEYVESAQEVDGRDVATLLSILSERELMNDAPRHRMRCHVFGTLARRVQDYTLFPHYLRALEASNRLLRSTLAPLFTLVTHVSKQRELCELLRSPDEDLRATVARVLREVGGSGRIVLQILGGMVGEPGFLGRREAVDLLAPMVMHRAVPALRAALAAGKPLEKRQCLKYLGDSRYMSKDVEGALDAIGLALEDSNDSVAAPAVNAYCGLCSEDHYFERIAPFLDADSPSIVRAAVIGLGRFSSPRAIGALTRKLREGPNNVRLAVLDTLETIGTDDILPALVEGLSHKNLTVRTRAGEIMARLSKAGQLDMARTIIWLLRSRDVGLRRTAADLAQSVPDPRGELWPKLIRFLRDEDWWVRERIVDALVDMAGRQLSPLLEEYLSHPRDVVRRFAVETFYRLKDPETLGLLVRTAAEDEDWWVRERAIEAIAALGDERAVPHVVNIMKSQVEMQIVCLQALIDLNARSAASAVESLLGADHPDVRLKAIEYFAAFKLTSLAPSLDLLANDPNFQVRAAAMELLMRWQIATPQSSESSLSTLDALLIACAEQQGDDMLLTPERQPYIKRLGWVAPLNDRILTEKQVEALLLPHLSMAQREEIKARRDVDFSYEVPSKHLRFRVNVFRQIGGLSAVFRIIKGVIPDLSALGLPAVVSGFGDFRNGLVLVGGPTGSGKSTTLAAIVDYVNRTSARHIISLEDPIEILHPLKKSLVNQREAGTHTMSSATALRSTLRQDPNVLLVGEMRDLPTISFAVTAAETGHLVFGTLHTVSADTTVDRVVNAFPTSNQPQVRTMLADSMRAVLCQFLIPRKDGTGRCLAAEILLNNDAVANLVRKGKTFQIPSVIATSREQGMQSMDGELKRLVQEGLITTEEAYMRAVNKKEFEAPVEAETAQDGAPNREPE
ncbi:MAG: PilT/PilU family type 4a pilus ATPase [Vicinamibacteria bacterium]|nr:PilT/PilU family type 4a pilus ATPase [Vicinamibacteria bacterium]